MEAIEFGIGIRHEDCNLFDGSAASARALTTSARLSERLDARLVVLVPVPVGGDSAQNAQLLADATARVTDLGHRALVRPVASAVKAVARAIQAETPPCAWWRVSPSKPNAAIGWPISFGCRCFLSNRRHWWSSAVVGLATSAI